MPDGPAGSFRAHAVHGPEAVVVVAEGELDVVGAPRLMEALPRVGTTPVVLDLGSVAFMDSSGLRALLEAREACTEAGRRFALARPSEAVWRVLDLVQLLGEFEVLEAPPPDASS